MTIMADWLVVSVTEWVDHGRGINGFPLITLGIVKLEIAVK